jgi:multicomponent Na+:H+ antiporter subunit E
MTLIVIHLLLALAWTAVTGSFTPANFVLGFVLAGFCLWLVRAESGLMAYIVRTRRAAGLAWLFLIELIKSAWSVARIVARRNMNLAPGIVAYPLRVQSDVEIALLANLITLTPGTLSVDVSQDRSVLYIHAIDCSDPDGMRAGIADGFERRIMEVFQ